MLWQIFIICVCASLCFFLSFHIHYFSHSHTHTHFGIFSSLNIYFIFLHIVVLCYYGCYYVRIFKDLVVRSLLTSRSDISDPSVVLIEPVRSCSCAVCMHAYIHAPHQHWRSSNTQVPPYDKLRSSPVAWSHQLVTRRQSRFDGERNVYMYLCICTYTMLDVKRTVHSRHDRIDLCATYLHGYAWVRRWRELDPVCTVYKIRWGSVGCFLRKLKAHAYLLAITFSKSSVRQ